MVCAVLQSALCKQNVAVFGPDKGEFYSYAYLIYISTLYVQYSIIYVYKRMYI